jgi:1,4-alpha-glucan branching enzyme
MAKKGYFTFVLHSHLPYVRKAGRWPHGEEMIHEALAETYIPLLNALYDLKRDGVNPRLTIGLTPILLEQIADREVLEHFEAYLLEEIEVAEADAQRFERTGDHDNRGLALWYRDWYRGVLDSFDQRYGRNVVGAFRQLQDDGNLDILTSAATHGYLPLLERDSTIYAQLKTGIESSRRHLGRAPKGIWLPECGYRPAFYKGEGQSNYKPGIEEFLADLNLLYFFTDTHVIEGGKMVGKVVGDVHGPYGGVPKRHLVATSEPETEPSERSTFRPYYVKSTKVAVYGRDSRTGMQVWSARHGYPGEFDYREFHRKDQVSGLQYWRVTNSDGDLASKQLYNPEWAVNKAYYHAEHFAGIVADQLLEYYREHGKPGIVVSAYDTELFGHWWFEGILWLREVLRHLANHPEVGVATANEYLELCPPDEVLTLPESSWGAGGNHWTWMNPDTEWIWPLIHNAETRMEQIVDRYPSADGKMLELLNQLARELLLLTSSDWPFLISTGQARDYATGRFQQHLARFNHLAMLADSGRITGEAERFLQTAEDLDNPFPNIDYHTFARRERA